MIELGVPKALILVPYNAKIADITHGDVNFHTFDLTSVGIPSNAVMVILNITRMGGAQAIDPYPYSGTQVMKQAVANRQDILLPIVNGEFKYKLQLANDDFDVFCFGYFLQFNK